MHETKNMVNLMVTLVSLQLPEDGGMTMSQLQSILIRRTRKMLAWVQMKGLVLFSFSPSISHAVINERLLLTRLVRYS